MHVTNVPSPITSVILAEMFKNPLVPPQVNLSLTNLKFSPCIITVNHFY